MRGVAIVDERFLELEEAEILRVFEGEADAEPVCPVALVRLAEGGAAVAFAEDRVCMLSRRRDSLLVGISLLRWPAPSRSWCEADAGDCPAVCLVDVDGVFPIFNRW